jgi:riboflavin synthase alpha subunit
VGGYDHSQIGKSLAVRSVCLSVSRSVGRSVSRSVGRQS